MTGTSAPPRARRFTVRRLLRLTVLGALLAVVLGVGLAVVSPGTLVDAARWAALVRSGARRGFVTVDGHRLAWASLGDGRPIVLVHGLGGESTTMLPLAQALARRGFRPILVDLPGAGRSPKLDRPLDLDTAGTLALAAARALGSGERPPIVGHSLGGWIVAWQALEHPERCGPVVLLCAAGLSFEPPPLNELMPRTVEDGRKNLKRLFAHPPSVPYPVLWITVHRPRAANFDLLRSAASGRFLLDGLLGGLDRPALVIAAEKDGIVPADEGRAMAQQIPGAEFLLVHDASHMVIWEKPDVVAGAIAGFVDRGATADGRNRS